MSGAYLAVRVRGTQMVRHDIALTLDQLRLSRPNHAVVVPKNETTEGMLRKARDYIAYGEIDASTLEQVLRARGRLAGDRPLNDDTVQAMGFPSLKAFAQALSKGEAKLADAAKPVLRLNPPRGGYGGNKRHYPEGALGYWGGEIQLLIRRMV
ncbi:MAG TPA: 50S ribosomal protein L30 [Candidatus Thermoplasmatota archaeon]|nr:50S ribosomal protein L30 [Candidatus Thermoplasmatota archaeon]